MNEIVVDLDALGRVPSSRGSSENIDDSSAVNEGVSRLIRQDAFRRVLAKLAAKPTSKPEEEDFRSWRPQALDVMPNRSHDAILVSARRGDGKTTFLTDILTLVQDVQNGRDSFRRHLEGAIRSEQIGSIYSLGIVDPTLIEAKQHIVVIIIEKIKTAVDRLHDRTSGDKGDYEGFRTKLYELASGLTFLDGIGESMLEGKDWADPDFILDRGLDRANAAGGFERAFRRYVDQACRFLKVDAFVLAIDDVDTSFERGWPVLEALRKYLASPQLKVILAGDIKLYNLLVRQQQWKQMTKEFIDIERDAPEGRSYSDQLGAMVDVLQDQYLIKIVRPENRVDLKNLLYYADTKNLLFRSSVMGRPPLEDRVVFDRYGERLLALRNLEDRAVVRSTILRLPLRSSLQIVAGAWPILSLDYHVSALGSAVAPASQRYTNDSGGLAMEALDALRYVASQSLMSLDLEQEVLREADSERIFGFLAQWLTKKKLWPSMSRLHPEGVDSERDIVSICLAASLVEIFRSPHSMISYLIRICTIREKVDQSEVEENDLPALMAHLNVASNESSIQFVSRLAAWDAAQGRRVARGIRLSGAAVPGGSEPGDREVVVPELYGEEDEDFDRQAFRRIAIKGTAKEHAQLLNALPLPIRAYHQGLLQVGWDYASRRRSEAGFTISFANCLGSLRRALVGDAAIIAMIPASRITSGQQAENGIYSPLRLIAFVGEILKIGAAKPPADRPEAIRKLLNETFLLRSYPTPNTQSTLLVDPSLVRLTSRDKRAGIEDELDSLVQDDVGHEGVSDELVDLLTAWVDKTIVGLSVSPIAPVTLMRIWTRFTYAFDDIRDELVASETRYLGVMLSRAIIAFLHATGVESLRAAGVSLTTKIVNNPITSSQPFLNLLDNLQDRRRVGGEDLAGMSFFYAIFAFPLWGYFLDRTPEQRASSIIYKRYVDAVVNCTKLAAGYEISMNPGRRADLVEFDNLFDVLNSVALQGASGSRRRRRSGRARLKDVVAKLDMAIDARERSKSTPPDSSAS